MSNLKEKVSIVTLIITNYEYDYNAGENYRQGSHFES